MALLRFRLKSGKHYPIVNGQRIKMLPGDVIKCEKDEIKAFLHKFEQLDKDEPDRQPTTALVAVHRGSGKWIVRHPVSGAQINDGYLTRKQAESMVAKASGAAPPLSEQETNNDETTVSPDTGGTETEDANDEGEATPKAD